MCQNVKAKERNIEKGNVNRVYVMYEGLTLGSRIVNGLFEHGMLG